MGEAVKQIPESIRDQYPEIPWRDIAGMRDKVIHFYFGVNLERVWLVVKENIPFIRPYLQKIFTKLQNTDWTKDCEEIYVTKNIYENTYDSTELHSAQTEISYMLYHFELDSIPLEKWLTNKVYNDTIQIEQKTVRKIVSKNSNYIFTFTKYTYPSILYYQFVIRYSGMKKYLQ